MTQRVRFSEPSREGFETISKSAAPATPGEERADTPNQRRDRELIELQRELERAIEETESKITAATTAGDTRKHRQHVEDLEELTNALYRLRRAREGAFGALEVSGERGLAKAEQFRRYRNDDLISDGLDEQLIKRDKVDDLPDPLAGALESSLGVQNTGGE